MKSVKRPKHKQRGSAPERQSRKTKTLAQLDAAARKKRSDEVKAARTRVRVAAVRRHNTAKAAQRGEQKGSAAERPASPVSGGRENERRTAAGMTPVERYAGASDKLGLQLQLRDEKISCDLSDKPRPATRVCIFEVLEITAENTLRYELGRVCLYSDAANADRVSIAIAKGVVAAGGKLAPLITNRVAALGGL